MEKQTRVPAASSKKNKDSTRNRLKRVLSGKRKRITSKIISGHSVNLEHAWIFQFVDIIYVATIFRISHMLEECGSKFRVYIMCFSYFVIMFSTRSAFDEYTCISGASGILPLAFFSLYGLGVFIMTINITPGEATQYGTISDHSSVHAASETRVIATDSQTAYNFGTCESNYNYDVAFVAAFIFTRSVIVLMYALHFHVFPESDDQDGVFVTSSQDIELVDSARKVDVGDNLGIPDRKMTIDDTTSGFDSVSPDFGRSSTNTPKWETVAAADSAAGESNAEPVVERHFMWIFKLKVFPMLLSSVVMLVVFLGAPMMVVLPIACIIEVVGDILPSFLISEAADWWVLNAHRTFAEERLGLVFMLVMGEAMLGLSAVPSHSEYIFNVYTILILSFMTTFWLGLQFFEPLQSYTKPEGPHPLDVQQLSPIYTWLVCLTCFFMLVASNGMVELYSESAITQDSTELHGYLGQEKVAYSVATVGLLTIVLKVLEKLYYREHLLPDCVFQWLNSFYERAACEEHALRSKKSMKYHAAKVKKAESNLTTHVSHGIRRILPLTITRICAAVILYASHGKIESKMGFMLLVTVLVALPSFIELVAEMHLFVHGHSTGEQ